VGGAEVKATKAALPMDALSRLAVKKNESSEEQNQARRVGAAQAAQHGLASTSMSDGKKEVAEDSGHPKIGAMLFGKIGNPAVSTKEATQQPPTSAVETDDERRKRKIL